MIQVIFHWNEVHDQHINKQTAMGVLLILSRSNRRSAQLRYNLT